MTMPIVLAFVVGISDMCMPNRDAVQRQYADAVRAGGHEAVFISRTTDTNALRRLVGSLDLVVLTGGVDVAPARYGERNEKSWTDERRDEFDFALMSACVAEKKPVLGICRGCQLVNVFFGGTLVQDIPSQWKPPEGKTACSHGPYPWQGAATNPPSHTVTFVPDSRLAQVWGTKPVGVTSHHHQAVKAVAPGFRVVATAPDGVAEAIEHETLPVYGVQFHPEMIAAFRSQPGFDIPLHVDFFRRLPELVKGPNRAAEISWSVFHPDWPDVDVFRRIVQKADEYGHVDSFEACGRCGDPNGGLNGFLLYEPYPSAAKDVDRDWVMKNRRTLGDIVELSHRSGRPFYYWHREIFMPKGVLKDVPELKDADGEFDLLGEAYAKYLRWKVDAAFKAVPGLDGIVLTLTEADFSVIHNSRQDRYPPVRVVEKIVRLFAEEHERRGKRLIVRSFGSIAPDYEQIIAGAKAAAADHRFEVETKATAYDFDPFLPDNPFLRKIPGTTLGTECDGLGEYLGAGYFPAAQVPVVHRYVRDAREQGADRYTIRIDRVGNSIFDSAHEVNLYAYMRFIRDPKATPDAVMDEWARRRWPKCPDEMKRLSALGFEAVKRTQFIDESVAFHQNPPAPSFKYIKSCGICSIFRDNADLRQTERMWGMLSDRRTPGRAAIRAEKDEAVRMANEGLRLLESVRERLDPAEYARHLRAWRNLVTVSTATRAYVRCACAYFDDMDANDAKALRLEAEITAADKAIAALMKDPNRRIGGYIDSCTAAGEDLDVAYLYPLRWLVNEFRREYRAEYAARQKFLARKDVVDFVIPGGLYDDVRAWRTAMHASYQSVDSGVPVRFAGNGTFPNGVVRVEFKDLPGAEIEIDLDPSGAAREDCAIEKTVRDGKLSVSIGKRRGTRYPAIRSIAQVRSPDRKGGEASQP